MNDNSCQPIDSELPSWDLSILYSTHDDPRIQTDLKYAFKAAQEFGLRYRGSVASLSAAALKEAVEEWERIESIAERALSFAELTFAANTLCHDRRALLESVRSQSSQIRSAFLPFELEWVALDSLSAERLLADPAVGPCAHFLSRIRRRSNHRLSIVEEQALRRITADTHETLSNLRDVIIANSRFSARLDSNEQQPDLDAVTALLQSPSREVRRASAQTLTETSKINGELLTAVINATIKNKALSDELRNYYDPALDAHIANGLDATIIETMLECCERRYDLVSRYYRLKATLLGLERLDYYDRLAPVSTTESSLDFNEARETVIGANAAFSKQLGEVVRMHFERGWINASPGPGKRDGAFTKPTVPEAHPFLLLNFNGRPADIIVMAHEVGHGAHFYLARDKGLFGQDVPIVIAETASVFGEMLVLQRLINSEHGSRSKLGWLLLGIERFLDNVFRPVAFTRFEQHLHAAFRQQGAVTMEQVGDLWIDTQRKLFGDSINLTADYTSWWLLIPHFVHAPFYCYGYAFGQLVGLALMQKSEEQDFPSRYLDFLSAGGTEGPTTLLAQLGFDISQAQFWNMGLDIIEQKIEEAERNANLL